MKVDLLIKDAFVFQTVQRKFSKKQVYIHNGKIYRVSTNQIAELAACQIIQAENQYLIPGLIDIHMHIESSMIPPETFSEWALMYGVTTVVADAHEIANVFGLDGIKNFFNVDTKLDIFQAIPSSVPSTRPDLETTGGLIGVAEVAEMLKWSKVICLGEAMDFRGISYEPDSLIQQIIRHCQENRITMPLEGHIPKIYDQELADFLASGITSDHTHQFPNHLLEKIEAGLFIQFQKKSITPENMKVMMNENLAEFACLITDDVMADDLLKGHLDGNVRLAISCGLSPEVAIYMATYTPARRMSLNDRGMIAPGKQADVVLLNNVETFEINTVFKKGIKIEKAKNKSDNKRSFPAEYYQSVHGRKLTREDFDIRVFSDASSVLVRAITKEVLGTFTDIEEVEFPVEEGKVKLDLNRYCYLYVQERYGKTDNLARSLIKQHLSKKGAIATTWAHDHHNLMMMGNDPLSIQKAHERIHQLQGGYVVVQEGQVVAECPLPLAGILSQEPLEVLGQQLQQVRHAMQQLGYENANEIMSFSTLSLPVSPAYKVTDKGLMDTKRQTFLPLLIDEGAKK